MVEIKKLTVSTDEQRQGWMELLRRGAQYHMDMAEAYKPEIIGAVSYTHLTLPTIYSM